jgi:hypothetical protein
MRAIENTGLGFTLDKTLYIVILLYIKTGLAEGRQFRDPCDGRAME